MPVSGNAQVRGSRDSSHRSRSPRSRLDRLSAPLLVLILLLGIAATADAAKVEITYELTGGSCCLDLEASQFHTVLGGTATIRWSLSSLNGAFLIDEVATIVNFTVTHTGGTSIGLFQFTNVQDVAGSQSASITTGTLPLGGPVSVIRHGFGSPSGLEGIRSGFCVVSICGFSGTVPLDDVSGQEVSRTLVGGSPLPLPVLQAPGVSVLAIVIVLVAWLTSPGPAPRSVPRLGPPSRR